MSKVEENDEAGMVGRTREKDEAPWDEIVREIGDEELPWDKLMVVIKGRHEATRMVCDANVADLFVEFYEARREFDDEKISEAISKMRRMERDGKTNFWEAEAREKMLKAFKEADVASRTIQGVDAKGNEKVMPMYSNDSMREAQVLRELHGDGERPGDREYQEAFWGMKSAWYTRETSRIAAEQMERVAG